MKQGKNVLNKTVSLATALLFLLKLAEFKRAERLEDVTKVLLANREVNVTHVEAMERDTVREGGNALGVTCLTVLLCFSELRDDRDSEELLAGELEGLFNRFFLPELNITNTLGAVAHTVLDDLGLLDRADLREEVDELVGPKAGSKLLNEHRTSVTLIISRLRWGTATLTRLTAPAVATGGAVAIATVVVAPAIAAIVAPIVTAVGTPVASTVAIARPVVTVIVVIAATVIITTVARGMLAGAVSSVTVVANGTATPAPAPDTSISTASITFVVIVAHILGSAIAGFLVLVFARRVPIATASATVGALVEALVGARASIVGAAERYKLGIVVEFRISGLVGRVLLLLILTLLLPLSGVEKLFDALEVRHGVGESGSEEKCVWAHLSFSTRCGLDEGRSRRVEAAVAVGWRLGVSWEVVRSLPVARIESVDVALWTRLGWLIS